MRFTIHSRTLGKAFEFWAPSSGGYVRREFPNRPGTLGHQICEGGGHMGDTLTCGDSQQSLERVARRWYRQHMRLQREMGYPDEQA
jgi:hypothetical protein